MRKHMLIFIVLFVTTLFVSTFVGEKEVSSQEENKVGLDEMYRFIFFSVLEGLFEDNVEQEVVQIVLQNGGDFFVPKCAVCWPVQSAFDAYDACVERNVSKYVTEESAESAKRISDELKSGFSSKDRNTRLMTLQGLVNRCVSSRFEMLKMSEKEKQDMQALMAKARESTMKKLLTAPEFGDFCASCDGACNIKKEK